MRNHILAVAVFALAFQPAGAADLTLDEQEAFLRQAPIVRTYPSKKGITGTTRATLSDGVTTHDASIQTIDEYKAKFETATGVEINFQDSYKLNIAAYRLARLLKLTPMVPVSVERLYGGKPASFTWWIDNIVLDEADRLKKKLEPPDRDRWARQYHVIKIFDQLIYNVDRNATNILYDKDWRVFMIDHSRAFRRLTKLPDARSMERCDAEFLARLTTLRLADLRRELKPWLQEFQITAILARRDLIVKHFQACPEKLYDYLPPGTATR
jgi:hypothetical protein